MDQIFDHIAWKLWRRKDMNASGAAAAFENASDLLSQCRPLQYHPDDLIHL